MEVKKHELIEQELCKKLDEIESELRKGSKMSAQDYELIKCVYSALVKKKAYEGMLEYEEPEEMFSGYSGEGGGGGGGSGRGNSGYRGRAANGRFVSRESGESYESGYSQGYSQGYSEAMNQMSREGEGGGGGSGHYPPMMMQNYPRNNRW